MIGWITAISRNQARRPSIFTFMPEPDPDDAQRRHSAVTSATYASSSVGSRDETRPTSKPSSSARSGAVSSRSPAVWTRSSCFCSRSSTVTDGHAVDRAQPCDGRVVDAERVDLGDAPFGDAGLQLLRRALADDPSLGDHGDPVAERVGLEHVVRRQEHGLARRRSGRRSSGAARARRPGRRRSSARRGTRPPGRGGSRARCAAAGACRASSPRPAPARGPSGRRARAPRRCAARCALPETP